MELFSKNNLNIPILIAGATTSKLHTAVKLEPLYKNKTIHVTDAIDTLTIVNNICSDKKEDFLLEKSKDLHKISEIYFSNKNKKEETIQESSENIFNSSVFF